MRADLTRPAINHYFPSKRMLYREVVDETNEMVVAAGIKRAGGETTLMGRRLVHLRRDGREFGKSVRIGVSGYQCAGIATSSGTELIGKRFCRTSREFLTWAVNDAIERGEVAADVDARH